MVAHVERLLDVDGSPAVASTLPAVIPMRLSLTLAALTISAAAPDRSGPLHRISETRPATKRTISTLTYLESYSATSAVKVYRGVAADIVVKGSLVDLATGVEVRSPSGASTKDILVFTGARKGGDNSSINIAVSTNTSTPLGTYQVLLHYLVETNGPDKFDIRVFDHGKIDNLSIVEPPEASGTYFTGKTYTLKATGSQLSNAELFIAKTGIPGLTVVGSSTKIDATVAAVSTTVKTIFIRFANGGQFRFLADEFFDGNLTSPPPTSCTDQCYEGNGLLNVPVTAVPVIAGVSPTTPTAGSTVSISGTSLTSPGFVSQVRAHPRYGRAGDVLLLNATLSGSALTFTAPPNMRQDSIALEFRPSSASTSTSTFSFRLPNIAVQGGTPVITQLDSISTASGVRYFLVGGTRTILGKFLAPNPLVALLTLAVDPSQITTVPTSPLNVQLAGTTGTTAPASPTIKFGQNDLLVRASRYFPTAEKFGQLGVDSVTFDMFNFTDTVSKTLTVTTPGGTVSVPNVLSFPPPKISFIRRKFSTGQTVDVNDNVLFRGATYEVGGVALILASSGSLMHFATTKLNGQTLSPALPIPVAPGSALTFTIPANATSGALTLETRAGTVTRNVTVQDLPAPVSIVGLQASPSDVVGGQPVTATIAFNAAIAAGTTAGTLVFTQSATTPTIALPGPVSIRANPTTVQIPTRVTRAPVTSVVTVTNAENNGGSGASSTTTITVRPPSPTGIGLSSASVVGGQPVTATVQMNGSAVLTDSILITLTTDDPTSVTIPASVFLTGGTAAIQVTTRVVPTTRTVTINAASGGQTRSATLTLQPPTITTVAANPRSTISPSTVPVTVTLSAALPSTATAPVACSGQGLTCPTSVSLSGSTGSFNVTTSDVPTARTGTITVTFNGVATNGTLDIQPLAVQSMTVAPAAIQAGANSSFTLQLNRATTSGLTFSFTSSDPTVVPAPAAVTFTSGQITKLVPITSTAPQSVAKTVTITATATRTTTLGSSTITKTATITVNP